jgi:uncharacterized protein (TIGR02391 family)
MTNRIVDSLRRLQEYIFEVGLARSVLALPAPRMLALPSSTGDEAVASNVFAITVTEPEIEAVSRDLFASGHYSLSVQEAYKAVDKYISDKSGELLSGTSLMDRVFSPNGPLLAWTDRKNQSERDEQMGYHRLYSGAMLGIRNPVTHEFNWIDDQEIALELLVFAQHLLRKAKAARIESVHLAGIAKP